MTLYGPRSAAVRSASDCSCNILHATALYLCPCAAYSEETVMFSGYAVQETAALRPLGPLYLSICRLQTAKGQTWQRSQWEEMDLGGGGGGAKAAEIFK